QLPAGLHVLQQPCGVVGQDVLPLRLALSAVPVALRRHGAEVLDLFAEERLLAHHHLEAIVVGRIVRPRDLDAAVDIQVIDGEVEHGRGDDTDIGHVDAGFGQALDAGRRQLGRTQSAVVAQRRALAPLATDHGAEAAADGARIGGVNGFADDAAYVV